MEDEIREALNEFVGRPNNEETQAQITQRLTQELRRQLGQEVDTGQGTVARVLIDATAETMADMETRTQAEAEHPVRGFLFNTDPATAVRLGTELTPWHVAAPTAGIEPAPERITIANMNTTPFETLRVAEHYRAGAFNPEVAVLQPWRTYEVDWDAINSIQDMAAIMKALLPKYITQDKIKGIEQYVKKRE